MHRLFLIPALAGGEHAVRAAFSRASLFAHNTFDHIAQGRIALRINGADPDGFLGRASRHNVVSRNRFRIGETFTGMSIGPQSQVAPYSYELVESTIVEGNFFFGSQVGSTAVFIAGPDATVRNNIFDMSGVEGAVFVNSTRLGRPQAGDSIPKMPLPDGLRVQNNTCYTGSSTPLNYPAFRCGEFADHFNADTFSYGVSMRNNLLYAPLAESNQASMVEAGAAVSVAEEANVRVGSLPFASLTPTAPNDFELAPDHDANTAGVALDNNVFDFAGEIRGDAASVGAYRGN